MKQSDRDMLIEVHTDVKWVKSQICGNGNKGLLSRVRSLEKWKYVTTGGALVIASLIGWGVIIIR